MIDLDRELAALSRHGPVVLPARIVLGQGPYEFPDGERYSYYENREGREDYDTVYWIPWLGGRRHRSDLGHELGHVHDHKCETAAGRRKLSKRWGFPHRPWFEGDLKHKYLQPVEEEYADEFARVCMFPKRKVWLREYLYSITPEEWLYVPLA